MDGALFGGKCGGETLMSASVPGIQRRLAWPSNTIDTRVRLGFQLKCVSFAWVTEEMKL